MVLSKELWDKVVEKHKLGEGYKKDFKGFHLLRTVQGIIKKWKAYGTTNTLPRLGPPSNLYN